MILRRSPGFAAAAILTFALGIGANTAIFTVVNAVLLRPLPYSDPSRLVAIWDRYEPNFPKLGVSPTEYDEVARQTDLFADAARFRYVAKETTLTGGAEPSRVQATCASSSLFRILGAHPILGRAFTPADDALNAAPIALLSNRLWREYFNANPNLVGAPIQLNGQSFTVAGVLPPDFHFPAWADIWLTQSQAGDEITSPVRHAFGVIARLKPGAGLNEAQTRLQTIAARLERQNPKTSRGFAITATGLQKDLAGNLRPALLALLGAVTLVLLIACVNVANLLLSRAAARRREMAIRIALGAGRWRIARDSLAESLQLSLAGGAAGLLLAYFGLDVLLRLAPANSLDPASVHFDATTFGFLLAVSAIAGIGFGIAPALQAWRQDPNDGLKAGGRTMTAGRGAGRGALVVAEVALALVLLMGAGLLIRSFARMLGVDPGFEASNVLTLRVQVSPKSYDSSQKQQAFFNRLQDRLSALPGVSAVAATNALPLENIRANTQRFVVPGSPLMRPDILPVAQRHLITPDYFRALGIRLLAGRSYADGDLDKPYIIINETMARTYWPGENAVGKRFITGPWGPDPSWSTVIGVAADVKQFGLDSERTNDLYFLYYGPTYLAVRTASDALALAPAIRREIRAIDPGIPVSDFRTMQQVIDASSGSRRFTTLLLSVFAAVALALAVIGIYGIMAWSVAQRTQEIGVRMAVGAGAWKIFGLILGRGLRLGGIGLAIGLAATFALTRILASLLFEVSPHDPWILAGASVLMVAVTLGACYVPARRAMRVDPIDALRSE